MAMPALTSMTSPSQTHNNHLRDASFTSYLKGAEDSFVCKLAGPSLDPIPKVAVQQDHHDRHLLGRKKAGDGEIGVFGAEKYFTGAMDEGSPKISSMTNRKCASKKDEQNDAVNGKLKVHAGTPSIISESSWNSQSSLLQAILRNQSQRKTDKVKGKSFLAGLGCKCSCSDKDSVDVYGQAGAISFNRSPDAIVLQGNSITEQEVKTSLNLELKTLTESRADELGNGLDKETCFTFPVTNSGLGNVPIKKQDLEQEELISQKSLEVFGSPINDKRSKSYHLEPRLTMFCWDANPRAEEIRFSATPGGEHNGDESDASSELFEIESLSGKVIPFPARISDAPSDCATPTTCYAPSEASIEWSVVTASAAEFSVVSDYEELRPPAAALCPVKDLTANAKSRTDVPKRRPSILLGCKSQEAVKVVGDAHIKNDKNFDPQMRRVSDSYMPLTRFQVETKQAQLKHLRSKIALVNHSLPRSHSNHNSHLL